jgi:hypothetical protein
MQKRISTIPEYVFGPLSSILMSLDISQLRQILFDIISWDTTGKDIFNSQNIFDDPIEGIPDITLSTYNGKEGVCWIESFPRGFIFISQISFRIISFLSFRDCDELGIFNLALDLLRGHILYLGQTGSDKEPEVTNDDYFELYISIQLLYFSSRSNLFHSAGFNSILKFISTQPRLRKLNLIIRDCIELFESSNSILDIEKIYLDYLFTQIHEQTQKNKQTNKKANFENKIISKIETESNVTPLVLHSVDIMTSSKKMDRDKYKNYEISNWHNFYLKKIIKIGFKLNTNFKRLEINSSDLFRSSEFDSFWTNDDSSE